MSKATYPADCLPTVARNTVLMKGHYGFRNAPTARSMAKYLRDHLGYCVAIGPRNIVSLLPSVVQAK